METLLEFIQPGGLIKRARTAGQLIGLYKLKPEQRVDVDDDGINLAIEAARKLGSDGVAIEYANFSQTEVMQVVAVGEILPPGLLNYRLEQRVLMNYPLDILLDATASSERSE